MARRIDMDKFEQDVYREIAKGNTTCNLIAQALKMSHPATKFRLDMMFTSGKISRRLAGNVWYYSKGYFPAHDPFGLARKAA